MVGVIATTSSTTAMLPERSTLIAVIQSGRVRQTFAVAWFVAGLVVLCSCTSSGVNTASSAHDAPARPPTTTTTQPRLLPGHTSWIETFVDTSRRTVPTDGAPLPSRTL